MATLRVGERERKPFSEDIFKRLSDPSSTVRETCAMHHADLSLKMADMACYCMKG